LLLKDCNEESNPLAKEPSKIQGNSNSTDPPQVYVHVPTQKILWYKRRGLILSLFPLSSLAAHVIGTKYGVYINKFPTNLKKKRQKQCVHLIDSFSRAHGHRYSFQENSKQKQNGLLKVKSPKFDMTWQHKFPYSFG